MPSNASARPAMRYHPAMDDAGIPDKPTLLKRGSRTPDIVRDEAFRLWLAYGRSWVAVSRVLGCDESTLRKWGKAENWEQRRVTELAAALPGMRRESDVSLLIARHDASIRLQQIAHDAAHNGIAPNHKEVVSLSLIVDRGTLVQPAHQPPHDDDLDLLSLSDAELLALERGNRR